MLTPNEITLKYREQFLKNQNTFESQYKGIFNKMAADISKLAADPNAKFTKAFNFNKPIKVKIDGIIQNFQNQTLGLTEKMISDSWDISNNKNDEIVNNYLKTVTGLKTAETASYFLPNTPALEAFISRANNATTLADTVWNISKQARAEMETHLGIGIVNGDSAQVISQRIRQYLQNPQALFRRVRDKNGKLIASQAMRENAPGQGVYNSAFKNSMRVARTETNMAYLLSDNLRWQQNDLVLGVRISLSDQHKIVDICDDLIGDYPKYFIWVGWHPQDLCNATPILMPKADFQKYLESGGKLPKGKQITEMPENFKEYMKANIDRFEGYKSQPYFITDNKAIIDGIVKGGVKNVVSPIAGIVEQAVKTEFVAAKSIQEAEKFAIENGLAKSVNYKGIDIEIANAFNKQIYDTKIKYGIDSVNNINVVNRIERNREAIAAYSHSKDTREFLISSERIGEIEKFGAKRYFSELARANIIETDSWTNLAQHESFHFYERNQLSLYSQQETISKAFSAAIRQRGASSVTEYSFENRAEFFAELGTAKFKGKNLNDLFIYNKYTKEDYDLISKLWELL